MRKVFLILVTTLFAFSCEKDEPDNLKPGFSGGDGTLNSPYLIGSAEDLDNIRHYVNQDFFSRNAYFKQISDIDLSVFSEGKGWEPIEVFSGNYDGNGYIISTLTINRPDEGNLGLFGKLEVQRDPIFEGNIKNIILEDVHIVGGYETGAIAGRNSGTLINCLVTGKIVAKGRDEYMGAFGGLVGINNGSIHESSAIIEIQLVDGYNFVAGGLAGISNVSSILRSFAGGEIMVSNNDSNHQIAGGMVGMSISWPGTDVISDCYAYTIISGGNGQILGGLMGQSNGNLFMINSYAVGSVSDTGSKTGGLIGDVVGGLNVKDSFWDINTTGQESSSGSGSEYGKTTEEMKMQQTFYSWDFNNIWKIEEGISYPLLRWQE